MVHDDEPRPARRPGYRDHPELRKHFGAAADRGILVGRVEPRSDAEAAGLRVGDVIVEVRGSAVTSAGDVLSALGSVKQGDTVALTVVRDGRPRELDRDDNHGGERSTRT